MKKVTAYEASNGQIFSSIEEAIIVEQIHEMEALGFTSAEVKKIRDNWDKLERIVFNSVKDHPNRNRIYDEGSTSCTS